MSWAVILVIGLATYALRASFLLVFDGEAPAAVERALRYVPVAVLPALATSAVIGAGGGQTDLRIVAALIAAFVAWKTRSVAGTMVGGMLALWALQALSA